MKKIMLALGIMITLAACKDAQKTMQEKPLSEIEGEFNLTELPGVALGDKIPHIVFKPGESQVVGNTGCNSFFGSYGVEGDRLVFGDIASTEMDCGPDIMRVERSFFNALRNAGKAALTDSSLMLYDRENEQLLLAATKKSAP